MTFPVVAGEGFLWDLRWVPFAICVLYMGDLAGAICGLILISYRFSLGGITASLTVLSVAIIIFYLFQFYRRYFPQFSKPKKYIMNTTAAVMTFFIVLSAIWIESPSICNRSCISCFNSIPFICH
jgi:two-component system sporulation sensor kinase B